MRVLVVWSTWCQFWGHRDPFPDMPLVCVRLRFSRRNISKREVFMEKKEKVTLYWFSKEITRMMSGNWNSSIAKRIDPIGSSCNGSGQCFVFTHMRIVFPFFFFPPHLD